MCEALVGLGASLDAKTDDLVWTPLHCAAQGGFVDVCMALVKLGADLRARDCVDNMALQLAGKVACRPPQAWHMGLVGGWQVAPL